MSHTSRSKSVEITTQLEQAQTLPADIQLTRIRQDDFLAQLAQALATYDTDGDGLLSESDWLRVADDLCQTG